MSDIIPTSPSTSKINTLAFTRTYDVLNAYNRWVVYMHTSADAVLWVGMCSEAEMLGAPDARRNKEWLKRTAVAPVTLSVLAMHDNEHAARMAWLKAVAELKPVCNLVAVMQKRHQRVQCIETGAIFRTAVEACRMVGCSAAAMSNHLNGSPHQKTVRNFTFKRVD